MLRNVFAICLIVIGGTAVLSAQTPISCDSDPTGPFVVTTGRSFTVGWCQALPQTQPDGTKTGRYDGFYLQIDSGPRVDVGVPAVAAVSTLTQRTGYAVLTNGVQKGLHQASVTAYVYVLDDSGQPTGQRLESAPVVAPFSAVDPVVNVAPPSPSGVRIVR